MRPLHLPWRVQGSIRTYIEDPNDELRVRKDSLLLNNPQSMIQQQEIIQQQQQQQQQQQRLLQQTTRGRIQSEYSTRRQSIDDFIVKHPIAVHSHIESPTASPSQSNQYSARTTAVRWVSSTARTKRSNTANQAQLAAAATLSTSGQFAFPRYQEFLEKGLQHEQVAAQTQQEQQRATQKERDERKDQIKSSFSARRERNAANEKSYHRIVHPSFHYEAGAPTSTALTGRSSQIEQRKKEEKSIEFSPRQTEYSEDKRFPQTQKHSIYENRYSYNQQQQQQQAQRIGQLGQQVQRNQVDRENVFEKIQGHAITDWSQRHKTVKSHTITQQNEQSTCSIHTSKERNSSKPNYELVTADPISSLLKDQKKNMQPQSKQFSTNSQKPQTQSQSYVLNSSRGNAILNIVNRKLREDIEEMDMFDEKKRETNAIIDRARQSYKPNRGFCGITKIEYNLLSTTTGFFKVQSKKAEPGYPQCLSFNPFQNK